jgi:hypothetical protein
VFSVIVLGRANVRMLHEHPGAGVPAQGSVFISGGMELVGLFEILHGLGVPLVRHDAAARIGAFVVYLGPPFAQDAQVVRPFVFVRQPLGELTCLIETDAAHVAELIRNGQHQADLCLVIVRLDLQDVPANALRFPGLVEQTIPLGLLQGPWDAFLGE